MQHCVGREKALNGEPAYQLAARVASPKKRNPSRWNGDPLAQLPSQVDMENVYLDERTQ